MSSNKQDTEEFTVMYTKLEPHICLQIIGITIFLTK